jgi:hypothetical protein
MADAWACRCGHRWEQDPGTFPALCPACGAALVDPQVPTTPDASGSGQVPEGVEETNFSIAVPGYDILEELGRGGMGIVYKAWQVRANRAVALKMILAGAGASQDDLARFANEARAVAALQHPNIVQVHEVGEHQGHSFFSLELCEGGTLEHRLHGVPLPCQEAAQLVQTLAQAVYAAHEKHIIHRDLKPSNILFTSAGIPKVADFGLAKVGGDRPGGEGGPRPTITGTVMGTPSYMAPEQAGGKTHEISPRVDVYALGALLYECLTGRPPFQGATAMDTLMEVLERNPVPPRLLNSRVEHDLESICLKCLEKDPALRYASARDLAEDLGRYLEGMPVQATSLNVIDRLTRALEQGKHAPEFGHWGTLLLLFGVIVFIMQTCCFVLIWLGQPVWQAWLLRFMQFVLMGLVFWKFRDRMVWPTSAAEKQLWSIWIGYFIAFAAIWLISRALLTPGLRSLGPPRSPAWEGGFVYPFSTVLAGFAFFVMGSNYWGQFYTIGIVYLLIGIVMAVSLTWAPLLFALLWGGTLTLVGLHLRRLHAEREQRR